MVAICTLPASCTAFQRLHIATIAPQSTDEAISLMRDLESLPVDGVMIFSAATFRLGKSRSQSESPFLRGSRARTKLPIVLFPGAGQKLLLRPETVCRIARLENVLAFKEASFDINLFTETIQALSATKPLCVCSPATTASSREL